MRASSRPPRHWLISVCCAAATLALAGLTAAPAAARAGAAGQAGPANRSNVGATHSPEVLDQLAHPAGMTPMTGSGQLAPGVTPSAAAPGDEQGIDVASFQHPNGAAIEWPQVAASGIGFAAVKVTEGDYYRNPYALTDLAQAQAAGLSVAAYAFAIPNGNGSSSNPVTQADYLLSDLGAQARSVPVMLDLEYNPYGTECYGLTSTAMVAWINKFDSEVKARTGRLPIVYTPKAWWAACTGSSTGFGHTPLWVPDYSSTGSPARPAGWSTWASWQYSSTGTVPGIAAAGQVDLDQANPAVLGLLDPGNQKQTTGDPVSLQLQQAIPAPGPAASYTATGLPAGLSLSPAGQLTGWVKRAGSYQVQVSASTAAGITGAVSFGWSVAAAPDQGPAGPVRFGVGGKCLNDTGNKSADGTPLDLWTCNGSSSQQWTLAQDQTLRIHGKCLAVSGSAKANGAKAVLATCSGFASQQWTVGTGAQLVNATAGLCLGGSAAGRNGSQAWIAACNGQANQKWTMPAGPVVSGVPGICLTDQGGRTTAGNPVVTSACGGQPGQAWAVQPDGTVRFAGGCLEIGSSTAVDLSTCDGSAAQQWQITAAGGGQWLRNPQSGACLADPGDSMASGTPLTAGSCSASDPGAVWRVR
jgi:GH25 family lysozyme M1 (1,4-beta-N-acetylmuramidase)